MSNRKIAILSHLPQLLLITALNCIIMLEPFLYGTKAAMLDANAHILTISQFYKALSDGEFPVMWADKFANYGLPLGTIAHQIPNYLGGLLTFLTHDPLVSYHLLILIALVASAVGVYALLQLVVSAESALLATTVYSFATYRITNIYVRGAMPEIFMALWLPYILALLYRMHSSGDRPYIRITVLLTLLILSHPMSLVLYIPFIAFFAFFMFRENIRILTGVGLSLVTAIGLCAYYLIPLKLESKYLYMGSYSNLFVYDQSVDWSALWSAPLRFTCLELNYIFSRCADITFGSLELILGASLILGACVYWFKHRKTHLIKLLQFMQSALVTKEYPRNRFFIAAFVCMFFALFFSSSLSEYLYTHIPLLGNIQIPSRFMSLFYFFFALIIAYAYEHVRHFRLTSIMVWTIIYLLIITLQFPQIYGKNYTSVPAANFTFAKENYHGLMMQPKWTIDSTTYPVVPEKALIMSGKGTIEKRILKNASRNYLIHADTEVLVSDHTFYFPGWNVYIDGNPTTIEFQDHAYRGVITFKVPPGTHDVVVIYQDTKIRRAGKYISLAACISLIVYGIFLHLYSRKTRSY